MFILIVHAHVKPDCVEAFRVASLDNARNSVREPGTVRFDVVKHSQDPTRFVLVEVDLHPRPLGVRAIVESEFGAVLRSLA